MYKLPEKFIDTKFLHDLDLEECSIYGFESRIQLQGTHGYWHPYQLRKTNTLIKITAGVLEKEECITFFDPHQDWDNLVNDGGRLCAQIPSKETLLTMVKLS